MTSTIDVANEYLEEMAKNVSPKEAEELKETVSRYLTAKTLLGEQTGQKYTADKFAADLKTLPTDPDGIRQIDYELENGVLHFVQAVTKAGRNDLNELSKEELAQNEKDANAGNFLNAAYVDKETRLAQASRLAFNFAGKDALIDGDGYAKSARGQEMLGIIKDQAKKFGVKPSEVLAYNETTNLRELPDTFKDAVKALDNSQAAQPAIQPAVLKPDAPESPSMSTQQAVPRGPVI